jgi:hypothetical protein
MAQFSPRSTTWTRSRVLRRYVTRRQVDPFLPLETKAIRRLRSSAFPHAVTRTTL